MNNKENICFDCINAVGGCSWSQFFKPVKGWTAKRTKIKVNETTTLKTYYITACPLFIQDNSRRKPKLVKQEIQETINRKFMKKEHLIKRELEKVGRLDLWEELERSKFIWADIKEDEEK